MAEVVVHRRGRQVVGWLVVSLFALGFVDMRVGLWTGPILALWFVGTQRVGRGFAWMMLFTLAGFASSNWRHFALDRPRHTLESIGWMLLVSLMLVVPFVFHRLVSPWLPGIVATLPLAVAGAALRTAATVVVPAWILRLASPDFAKNPVLGEIASYFGSATVAFLVCWFAALVVQLWYEEAPVWRYAVNGGLFAGICVVLARYGAVRWLRGIPYTSETFDWTCLGVALGLAAWALVTAWRQRPRWSGRQETIARLQSPWSGKPLRVARVADGEVLVSAAGERYPIRNGIAWFVKRADLEGANGKYNRLYQTIGGFYDDTQRVWCALSGMDRDAYVRSYLGKLEVRPGDAVLETSVGTGLNFRYLPREIRRFGVDLSREMLVNCQRNLRRWRMDADLFLGNAERLPFADASFDVVFHTGGINFFSDRAAAIREMIRVARPGSLLLIADETEKHVREAYERIPYTREFFREREGAVTAPVALVPAEMEDVRVETVWNGRFYALTFRKPRAARDAALHAEPAGAAAARG